MSLADRRVLYISYNGMLDPLGQSQVLPYLRELSKRGVCFTLLSFEKASAFDADGRAKCESMRRELAEQNIDWHWLRYHQNPSVPATGYDVLAGVRLAIKLSKKNRIEMVHARSHIAAAIALALKRRLGTKMIFDVRGLMAEEYIEAGHWKAGGIPYRLTKAIEHRAFQASDGIVTLTEKIWPIIRNWDGLKERQPAHQVVPCCVDLDLFRFSHEDRARRRAELGLGDRFTLVYSGSIGPWYMTNQMADFFVELRRKKVDAHFLWLTPGDAEIIRRAMTERGMGTENYTVKRAASADVASYLSASDAGIAFYKPGFSKLATSPVKVAEYLACGLPIVINSGIGDSEAQIKEQNLGALVNSFSEEHYASAVDVVVSTRANAESSRRRSREAAEDLFDLSSVGAERYASLYERVLS